MDQQLLVFFKVLTILAKEVRDIALRKLFSINPIKPWMKIKEIEIIIELLNRKKPKYCLEWGVGYSTLYFPRYLSDDAIWIAIEHDEGWAAKVRCMVRRPNTKIYCIPPNNYPWTDEHNDGSYADLRDYVNFPKTLGMIFDFILIDGRARKDCLLSALNLLDNEGIVVLHDANRKYYHNAFNFYKYQVLFDDYREDAGGLWIGSKGLNINTILDVEKHKAIWKSLAIFEKVLTVMGF